MTNTDPTSETTLGRGKGRAPLSVARLIPYRGIFFLLEMSLLSRVTSTDDAPNVPTPTA